MALPGDTQQHTPHTFRTSLSVASVFCAPLLLGVSAFLLSENVEQFALFKITERQQASLFSSIEDTSQLAYFSGGGTGGKSDMGNTTGKTTNTTSAPSDRQTQNQTQGRGGTPNTGKDPAMGTGRGGGNGISTPSAAGSPGNNPTSKPSGAGAGRGDAGYGPRGYSDPAGPGRTPSGGDNDTLGNNDERHYGSEAQKAKDAASNASVRAENETKAAVKNINDRVAAAYNQMRDMLSNPSLPARNPQIPGMAPYGISPRGVSPYGTTPVTIGTTQTTQLGVTLGVALGEAYYGYGKDVVKEVAEMARTAAGEVGGVEDEDQRSAAVKTMLNRIDTALSLPGAQKKYGEVSEGVVSFDKMLEAYDANGRRKGTVQNAAYKDAVPGTDAFNQGMQDVANALSKPKTGTPVDTATHYYNPKDASPNWSDPEKDTVYGEHSFANPDPAGTAKAVAQAQAKNPFGGAGTSLAVADSLSPAKTTPANVGRSAGPGGTVIGSKEYAEAVKSYNYSDSVAETKLNTQKGIAANNISISPQNTPTTPQVGRSAVDPTQAARDYVAGLDAQKQAAQKAETARLAEQYSQYRTPPSAPAPVTTSGGMFGYGALSLKKSITDPYNAVVSTIGGWFGNVETPAPAGKIVDRVPGGVSEPAPAGAKGSTIGGENFNPDINAPYDKQVTTPTAPQTGRSAVDPTQAAKDYVAGLNAQKTPNAPTVGRSAVDPTQAAKDYVAGLEKQNTPTAPQVGRSAVDPTQAAKDYVAGLDAQKAETARLAEQYSQYQRGTVPQTAPQVGRSAVDPTQAAREYVDGLKAKEAPVVADVSGVGVLGKIGNVLGDIWNGTNQVLDENVRAPLGLKTYFDNPAPATPTQKGIAANNISITPQNTPAPQVGRSAVDPTAAARDYVAGLDAQKPAAQKTPAAPTAGRSAVDPTQAAKDYVAGLEAERRAKAATDARIAAISRGPGLSSGEQAQYAIDAALPEAQRADAEQPTIATRIADAWNSMWGGTPTEPTGKIADRLPGGELTTNTTLDDEGRTITAAKNTIETTNPNRSPLQALGDAIFGTDRVSTAPQTGRSAVDPTQAAKDYVAGLEKQNAPTAPQVGRSAVDPTQAAKDYVAGLESKKNPTAPTAVDQNNPQSPDWNGNISPAGGLPEAQVPLSQSFVSKTWNAVTGAVSGLFGAKEAPKVADVTPTAPQVGRSAVDPTQAAKDYVAGLEKAKAPATTKDDFISQLENGNFDTNASLPTGEGMFGDYGNEPSIADIVENGVPKATPSGKISAINSPNADLPGSYNPSDITDVVTGKTRTVDQVPQERLPSAPKQLPSVENLAFGTRKLPVSPDLIRDIQETVAKVCGSGCTVEITSAGQPPKKPGIDPATGKWVADLNANVRVGSVRHDVDPVTGEAIAVDVQVRNAQGKLLSGSELAPIAQEWRAKNIGSVGLYANTETMVHLDYVGGPKGRPLGSGEASGWIKGEPPKAEKNAMQDAFAAGNKGISPELKGTVDSNVTVKETVSVHGLIGDKSKVIAEAKNTAPANSQFGPRVGTKPVDTAVKLSQFGPRTSPVQSTPGTNKTTVPGATKPTYTARVNGETVSVEQEPAYEKAETVTVKVTTDSELKKELDAIAARVARGELSPIGGVSLADEAAKKAGTAISVEQYKPGVPSTYGPYTVAADDIPSDMVPKAQRNDLGWAQTFNQDLKLTLNVPASALTKIEERTVPIPREKPARTGTPSAPSNTPGGYFDDIPGAHAVRPGTEPKITDRVPGSETVSNVEGENRTDVPKNPLGEVPQSLKNRNQQPEAVTETVPEVKPRPSIIARLFEKTSETRTVVQKRITNWIRATTTPAIPSRTERASSWTQFMKWLVGV